ncbi:hypothetical protein SUGI_0129620 [Cryptomeria japonica]|nr:hypothetical protein SUGI_0129620 [Cryptomeria japonica]
MLPLPGVFDPDFVAANQGERANNIIKGSKKEQVQQIVQDIRCSYNCPGRYSLWGMPACKTAVNYPSTHAVEERKDFSRESCADVSKRPFIREKYRRIKGSPCNRSTGKLGSLNMAPGKQELGITSEDNSDELFPEHNGNVVDQKLY